MADKRPELGRHCLERVTGIEPALSAWESNRSRASDMADLGTRHTVGDRDVSFDTGANGPPMARGPIASGTDQGPALLAARR